MTRATELRNAVKRDLTAEVIRQFGEVRLKVTGTSMLPSLWPGDEITVLRQSAAGLTLGQVVLCYRNQAFTAHRLMAKRDDVVVTRGDTLSYEDPPFRDGEVLGAVVSIVRSGRPAALSSAGWHRVISWIVRHSELCTRILLRMQRLAWAD
jgi:signal peptidase I